MDMPMDMPIDMPVSMPKHVSSGAPEHVSGDRRDRAPTRDAAGVPPADPPLSEHERAVIAALREIAYGEIGVVVHNARIVQITRSQKFRFNER